MASHGPAGDDSGIAVEVAYALPERQIILTLRVPHGTTPREAVRLSGIESHFPGLDTEASELGVFGVKVPADYVLCDGDRVEVYRPLLADPKEVRRQLAKLGKTMGKKKDKPAAG